MTGRVEIKFLDGVGDAKIDYTEVRAALAKKDLKDVLEGNPMSLLVVPGQELALVVPPDEQDEISSAAEASEVEKSKEPLLKAGKHVRVVENRFEAEIYGYVCMMSGQLFVIPPVWIAQDRMEAHLVHFRQPRQEIPPQPDWLRHLLELQGVSYGIEDLEKLVARLPKGAKKGAVLVAQGRSPLPGFDGYVKYTFDTEKTAGRISDDGSIDFRERNAAIGVEAGAHLGDLIPPARGQAGSTVLGKEVAAHDGESLSFAAGENVRVQSEGERQSFFSEIDGDADFESGNIDIPKDLHIGGSVQAEFTIKAGGNITIGGTVEGGATIHANGDVVAAQGIFGETTRVVAMGKVETKLIQNSTVTAHKDIVVGSYIFNGSVHAGGTVIVHAAGGDRGGSIVGGQVMAAKGIEARRVGSPETDRTVVGIGPDPQVTTELNKIRRSLQSSERKISRALRLLGLRKVDENEIAELLRKCVPAKRQQLESQVRNLKEARAAQEKILAERERLESEVAHLLEEGSINVSETMFSDVEVQIGNAASNMTEDVHKAVFFKTGQGVRWRPI